MASELAAQDADELRALLASLIRHWDGKTCIEQLRQADYQWRQMEWPGFYGELAVRSALAGTRFVMPGETFGSVTFDFKGQINWDVKVHCKHSSTSPLNDVGAMDASIARNGAHGLIIIQGDCILDRTGDFKAWHDTLKGGVSAYEVGRVARGAPSRARKTAVAVTSIALVPLYGTNIGALGRFQRGFRNSSGPPRNEKYLITRRLIDQYCL